MFDNVLYQSACDLLSDDIKKNVLPPSLLFSGPNASGKLTCALETARVLSCREQQKGAWNCTCPSCTKQKALLASNVLLMGPGEKTLEISAAKNTLLNQAYNSSTHIEAARYLFLRAVRKLTLRFNAVLWDGEDKFSKFSPLLQAIDEELEKIEIGRQLPENDELKVILDSVEKNAQMLEEKFLYSSIPVSQIRNCSAWAHLKSGEEKKIIIIENADCMAESAKNALLKILEEPPEDTVFVLTTTRRSSMMQTILSRVRTYNFFERNQKQQQEVITRVFHYQAGYTDSMPETVDLFLKGYLPVKPEKIINEGRKFFTTLAEGHVSDLSILVKNCNDFEPKILFSLFIDGIIDAQKGLCTSPAGCECSAKILEILRKCFMNVNTMNQNIICALDGLSRDLLILNKTNENVFKEVLK